MHDFRKPNRDKRQAVDGFINAPQRPQLNPLAPGRHGLSADRFRSTNGRRVDDFKRAEGYHPTTRSVEPIQTPITAPKLSRRAERAQQESILHMTLPGGALETNEKKKRKSKLKDSSTKHPKWRFVRRWGFRSGLIVVGLVLLIGGFLFTKGLLQANKIFKGGGKAAALQSEVKPELLKGEGDGRINILLMGKGGGDHDGPDLTDTILVASIDPINKTTTMVSIPRDLWVTVDGSSSKINAVYANHKYSALNKNSKDKAGAEKAGIKSIEATVTQVLGIPIHYYTMVDFQAFKQAVDTVGGVDINVPAELAVQEHLWDETTRKNYFLNVLAGMQHFDSTRALFFTRSRHTSPRGDFDRSERQRLFIQALSQKVLSAGTYTNPVKISQLMSAFGDHVSTDFSINDTLRLANIAKGINSANVKSIGLADPPNNYVRTDNIVGQSIVRPTAGIGDYSAIQSYIRNTLKDPYIARENAAIMVLNGTTVPGLAGTKGDQLKSYGYNIIKVDSAPTSDYQKTTLVDLTGNKKPFTKNYLEKRLGVKATTTLSDKTIVTTGTDFVLILGQDATVNSQD
ncbi:MAG TPA: LCP family protein [Candidatus Saccharimonadales bacterium]|jgi:LCP family protein required for cell wall assembly|nr:LCP family protein [Candidatus Saccharimonadales bacterium]